jgi:tight adherence protein C
VTVDPALLLAEIPVVAVDLAILAFASVAGLLASRALRFEYDHAVVPDWLRHQREEAFRQSSWLRTLEPLTLAYAAFVRRMWAPGGIARVRMLLAHAGHPNGFTADEFIGYALANATVIYAGFLLLFFLGGVGAGPIVPLLPAIGAYVLVRSDLKTKAERRRVQIDRQLPFVLDLIALTMGAGATFLEAVSSLVKGGAKGPIEEEFDLMLREVHAGTPLRDALLNMTKRSDSEELASMVRAVRQGEQLGTPLVEIFADQASTNRFRRSKRAEKIAAKLPNRLAVPTVFLMLAVLILLFGPIIVKAVHGGLY